MASKEEILPKLNDLADELARAREMLLKGQIVPIENVTERINEQCLAITELEPDDAIEVKPMLDALLANFQAFSQEIDYVQKKVEELLAAKRDAGGQQTEK